MDDTSRAIGRLEGKLDAVHTDVGEIKKDVKTLQTFKWRVAGGAAVLAFLVSSVVEFIIYNRR